MREVGVYHDAVGDDGGNRNFGLDSDSVDGSHVEGDRIRPASWTTGTRACHPA